MAHTGQLTPEQALHIAAKRGVDAFTADHFESCAVCQDAVMHCENALDIRPGELAISKADIIASQDLRRILDRDVPQE